MSQVSPTSPQGRFGPKQIAVTLAVIAGVLGLAYAPLRRVLTADAGQSSLHAPDLSVIWALSPVIKVHLFAALAAIVLGGVLMAVRKGKTFHRFAGWGWVALVALVAGSSLFITSLRPGQWSFIHLFTGWTLLVLPLAVIAAKRRDIGRHRRRMMGLFYGGFAINLAIAFIPGRALWKVFLG